MTHHVVDPVIGDGRIALTTHCRYPDGTNVQCVCTADVSGGLITRSSVTQVWDS